MDGSGGGEVVSHAGGNAAAGIGQRLQAGDDGIFRRGAVFGGDGAGNGAGEVPRPGGADACPSVGDDGAKAPDVRHGGLCIVRTNDGWRVIIEQLTGNFSIALLYSRAAKSSRNEIPDNNEQ
jgi:hypothetical protein